MNKLLNEKNLRSHYKKSNFCKSYFEEYKLDQLLNYKKYDDKYVNVKSNKQIKTLIKHTKNSKENNYVYIKLINLLLKHIHLSNAPTLIPSVISLPLSDSYIFRLIGNLRNTKDEDENNIISFAPKDLTYGGGKKKIDHLKFVLECEMKKDNFTPKAFLDFGCGDCKLVKSFGEALNIKKDNVYGADIASWATAYDSSKRNTLGIKFVEIKINQKYDFESNFFSVITCFMVLHHIENLDLCLKELNRILEMNGYLYLTEHMIINYLEKMLTDIEHTIYEISHRDNRNYYDDNHKNNYVNNTLHNVHHYIEWDLILSTYGFEYIKHDYISQNITDQDNSTKKAWLLYKKVKDIN